MFNFLRKLRRKEMKGGKYLKYAMGEIFLVVIGILIALSINNWNEKRKERAFEQRMLTDLKAAIDSDLKGFQRWEGFIDSWERSIMYLVDAINTKDRTNLNKDSVTHHLDLVWGFGVSINYSTEI